VGERSRAGATQFSKHDVFAVEKPVTSDGETQYAIKLKQNHGGWNSDDLQGNNLGKFRLSYTTSPSPEVDPVPEHIREIFAVPREQRSPAQVATLFGAWRATVAEWKDANSKIEELWKQHPEGTTQMALAARDESRQTSVLKRGDWLKPGQGSKSRRSCVSQSAPRRRADEQTHPGKMDDRQQAPTTARAFVNRVWQAYFGTGLVATSEDLGTQCEPPSHPELLDWLACEFMQPTQAAGEKEAARPWSIKHLQRLIVTSRTYRQSSVFRPNYMPRIRTIVCSRADPVFESRVRSSVIFSSRRPGCSIRSSAAAR
jgi:hypothetical protein